MECRNREVNTEQLTNILNGRFDVKNRDNDYFLVSSAMESKRKCPQWQITRCLWEAMLPQIALRATSQTPIPLSAMLERIDQR